VSIPSRHTRAIVFSLCLGALVACDSSNQRAEPTPEQSSTSSAETGKAEFGEFGIDLEGMDTTVAPGDDFFTYVNGTWYESLELPPEKGRLGTPTILVDRSRAQIQTIITSLMAKSGPLSANEQLVANYYQSFMDVDTVDERGLAPLQPFLDEIDAIDDRSGLARAFGRQWKTGINAPLSGELEVDRSDPGRYQFTLDTSGLGLPDRDYYLEDSDQFAQTRDAYREDITAMLTFAGASDPEAEADEVLALETRMAAYLWPREKRRNRDLTLNPIPGDELSATYPGFDWDAYLRATGFVAPRLNIMTPDALTASIALINETPLETWKSYLRYHLIANHASYLATEINARHFEFVGPVLRGQAEPEPRWRQAIQQMSGVNNLGFPLGKLYVAEHFPEESKAQMLELVGYLRRALEERIKTLEWMGEDTRANALAKLRSFEPRIGYPDKWPEVENVVISNDDLIGNILRLRDFFHQQDVSNELKPADRDRWGLTPQTVNAYYNAGFNQIVFSAAILQPPIFDPNADPAVNYGAIGGIIGHEMGHGFDDQGSKFDAYGVQRNWWTDEDRAAFEARTAVLVEQYSAYEPVPGHFINGENSLGENIGDVGGMAMAYHAYKLSLNGEEAPVINGLTGDQRFFLAYAQLYREKRTEASMLRAVRGGTHSPFRYRSLAVRNHDAWYDAFDVQPGQKLYLPPDKRARIW
jgi:putative endopeptidase